MNYLIYIYFGINIGLTLALIKTAVSKKEIRAIATIFPLFATLIMIWDILARYIKPIREITSYLQIHFFWNYIIGGYDYLQRDNVSIKLMGKSTIFLNLAVKLLNRKGKELK